MNYLISFSVRTKKEKVSQPLQVRQYGFIKKAEKALPQAAFSKNPVISFSVLRAIKETSFVYQDKRGFFLLSEQNKGRIIEKRALERSTGYSEARFLRSAANEYRYHCCTNRISLLCKQLLNVFRVWDLNLMFAKNPVRVMI